MMTKWMASITATGQLKVSPMRNYTMVGVIQAYRKTRLIFVGREAVEGLLETKKSAIKLGS